MKRFFCALLPLAAVLLGACEKEVTGIQLPESNSKLVVTSFISPQDTLVRVDVARSRPALGTRTDLTPFVQDALVTLSDGDRTINLPYKGLTAYAVDSQSFPVVAGRTYTLRVSVPGGESVEATCTVPEALSLPVLALDSISQAERVWKQYVVRLNWADPAGADNYYRVAAEVTREFTLKPGETPPRGPRDYPVSWEGDELIEDKEQDGTALFSPKGTFIAALSTDTAKVSLHAHVLHTDRNYFQYHRSIYAAARTDGNPFAEPVLVYSNITGGLGVFAAYNRATVLMKLR